jgi:hypothetical protein
VIHTNEDPLNSEWPTESPVVRPTSEAFDNGIGQQLSNDNGEINTGSHNTTDDDGSNLRAVERAHGQVEAQADTKDQLSDEEFRPRVGEYFSEDTACDQDEAHQEGSLSAKAIGKPTAGESTEELASRRYAVEGTLPAGREDGLSFVDVPKFQSELWNSNHGAIDLGVESPGVDQH